MKHKHLCFLFCVVLIMVFFACKSTTKVQSDFEPTDKFWDFQKLPEDWKDNEWQKGTDVDYGNGMTLLASKQRLKICPQARPPQLESAFSTGYLQPEGSGEVLSIKDVVGPVAIKVYYTGAGVNKERYAIIKINDMEVAVGENSPDVYTEKIVTVNYILKEKANVTILSNNGLHIFDVKIVPIEVIKAERLLLEKTEINIDCGKTVEIVAQIIPESASSKRIAWEVKDNFSTEKSELDAIAVNANNSKLSVLALRSGSAVVQATAFDEKTVFAQCRISVNNIDNFQDSLNFSEAEKLNITGNSEEVFSAIKEQDRPIGFANSAGSPENFGGYLPENQSTVFDNVDTYEKLKTALTAKVSSRIVYITGEIDLNGGKTPFDYITECGFAGTGENKFSSYEDYKTKFSLTCVRDSESVMHSVQQTLHKAQRNQAKFSVPSNTTIIGKTNNAALMNAWIEISNKENIAIRNVKIWNACDYFPLWYQSYENNFNSVMDNIEIDGSKWIWIDHCSLGEDPWIYDKVQTPVGELPWVTYDGVVDIGKSSDFVTVSWCHFQNHDKTMLIGYGANFINDAGKLHVTVHNNIFENCKGRLPLVRYGTVHVYKNKYFCDDKNKSGFCIGVGYASKIFAEENHFSECKYGFRKENATSTDNDGKIFYINNVDGSSYYDSTRKAISENIGWNPQNSYIYKF